MKKTAPGKGQFMSLKNKYLSLVIISFLFTFSAYAQVFQTNNAYGYQWKRNKIDSTFLIPTFCGVPTLRGSVITKQSGIAFDSCNARFYVYNPKTLVWDTIKGGSGSGGGSIEYILQGYATLIDSTGRKYTVKVDTTIIASQARLNNSLSQKVDSVTSTKGTTVDTIRFWKNGVSAIVDYIDRADGIVSGGVVTWSGTGLTFNITPAVYYIDGVRYTSIAQSITLNAADATNPRIDVLALDNTGTFVKITGVAAVNPVQPVINPATQIFRTTVTIAAGATVPSNTTQLIQYDTNTGEWTGTSSGGATVNFGGLVNPFNETHTTDIGAFTTGQTFTYTKPTGTVSSTSYNTEKLYVRLKAAFAATANIQVTYLNAGAVVSSTVTIGSTHGFDKTTAGSYQNISIPLSNFTFTSNDFNAIRFTLQGANASGLYVDYVQLLQGTTTPSSTGGTVTSVATGLGLSGGTITSTGTIVLDTANASVLSRQRAANTYQAIITPAALTKTDDANVTATLTGTPSTALLQAVNLTLGWTGTLANTRGGTGTGTYTTGDILYASAANTLSKLPIGTASQTLHVISGLPAWRDTGVAGASGSAISALTAATAVNTINNANYTQIWQWNSLINTTDAGLNLQSNSTLGQASNSTEVLRVLRSGANANASHSAYGITSNVTNTGTIGKNFGIAGYATGATTNIALFGSSGAGVGDFGGYFDSRVAIKTGAFTSSYDLEVGGTGYFSGQLTAGTVKPTGNLDFGSGGAAHAMYLYNGGSAATRTGISYLTAGALNAGMVLHNYGGLGAPILFGSGIDANATVATSAVAMFVDTKTTSFGGTADNGSTVQTKSFSTAYVAKTATYTIAATDHTIEATANTFTVTLPTAVGCAGRQYFITNSGTGTLTIGTTSSQTFVNVSGTPTTLSVAQFVGYFVFSNGANWLAK